MNEVTTNLVVPVRRCTDEQGSLALSSPVSLSSMLGEDALPLSQLSDELAAVGVESRVRMGAASATVFVRRDRSFPRPEQYRLKIGEDGIEVVSSTAAGAYYALQTVRDLVRIHGATIPCCRIEDWPTINRRGVYFDCSRGKVPTVETVKQLIEWLAHWKVNELQLYIENTFQFSRHPAIGEGYSPFSPDDMLAMQGHAKKHHVSFVPSLTSFGHFERILMLPEYRDLGELPGARNMPGGTTLCPEDPRSIELVGEMFEEFLPLFEAEDFNVCLDEPWELGRGRSKERVERDGLGQVYLDYTLKIRELCHRHGKRMNMWGDIVMKHPEVLPDLPRDIVVLNWDYWINGKRIRRTHELRELDLPFVCCPGTNSWTSHGSRLEAALTNVSMFADAAAENGAEGLMNTDWGNVGHRHFLASSLCSFAHGAAHGWCTEEMDDARHVERFCDLVFGDPDGELAAAVRLLGEYPLGIDHPYLALLEDLMEPGTPLAEVPAMFGGFRIKKNLDMDGVEATEEEIAGRREAVDAIRWPSPQRPLGPFEELAMEEYPMAARMETLGCRHMELARRLRAGESVPPEHLREHAEKLEERAEEFSELWLARNRPSRLEDNLAMFRAGVDQARELAAE